MENVIAALQTLYATTNAQERKEAGAWLDAFQQTADAWMVADQLLNSASASLECRLFGAQTIRRKVFTVTLLNQREWQVMTDLLQLDEPTQLSLRDSILNLILSPKTLPAVVLTQLCLALTGIAYQCMFWKDPFHDLVSNLGAAGQIGVLLEFLKVLPEEIRANSRIPIPHDRIDLYSTRADFLLSGNAVELLQMLKTLLLTAGK